MEFLESSPKSEMVKTKKYFWREVPIGKSFTVSCDDTTIQNLRSLANRYSKELGCRFVVVKWNDANIYEVAKKEL